MENIYWTFSTAAQAIAAIIGFAIAGHVFTYGRLQELHQDDDDARHMVRMIQKRLKRWLLFALVMSVITILYCLLILYIEPYHQSRVAHALGVVLIVATLVITAIFVMRLVDPNKYGHQAKNEAKKIGLISRGVTGDAEEFKDIYEEVREVLAVLTAKKYIRDGIRLDVINTISNIVNFALGQMDDILSHAGVAEDKIKIIPEQIKELDRVYHLVKEAELEQIEASYITEAKEVLETLQEAHQNLNNAPE